MKAGSILTYVDISFLSRSKLRVLEYTYIHVEIKYSIIFPAFSFYLLRYKSVITFASRTSYNVKYRYIEQIKQC